MTVWVLKQFLLAAVKGTNQSHSSNHVAASKVGVTQNSHDSRANDEIFNTCEHIAIWLSDQKYHGFQLCDLCIRINEKLQNPKVSPANEEPSEDEKAQHLQDVMIDMVMSFEFCKLRILKKNITSTTVDGCDNENMDSLTQGLHDEISTMCNACA